MPKHIKERRERCIEVIDCPSPTASPSPCSDPDGDIIGTDDNAAEFECSLSFADLINHDNDAISGLLFLTGALQEEYWAASTTAMVRGKKRRRIFLCVVVFLTSFDGELVTGAWRNYMLAIC